MKYSKFISHGTVFILGATAGWIASGRHFELFFTQYIPALVTLIAAYFGAKYAFEFSRTKQLDDDRKRNLVSGNLAIFNLGEMLNSLLSYKQQIIDPVRDDEANFLCMQATLPQMREDISIDMNSLSFLLGTDGQNIVGELSVEQSRYEAAVVAIKDRSHIHRYEAQPLLSSAGFKGEARISRKELEDILGYQILETLRSSTEQVISHVDKTAESIQVVAGKLSEILKKEFPSERVIRIEIPSGVDEPESKS